MSWSTAADGVALAVLWNLHREDDGRFTFYVNHIPLYDEQELRDLLYGNRHPDAVGHPVSTYGSEVEHAATALYAEVLPRVPAGRVLATEAGPLPVRVRHHLVRHPTDNWPGVDKHGGAVVWSHERVIGDNTRPGDQSAVPIALDSMSAAARAAVKLLDGIAVEQAYRRHRESMEGLTGSPFPGPTPPLRKYDVFVSYRKPQVATAKRVHGLFQIFGCGSHFRAFLDEHDIELGAWKPQFEVRIASTVLFVPVVTPDYALGGTVSAWELETAEKRMADGELDIAPIRVGRDQGEAWARLQHLHALPLAGPDGLDERSPEVQNFLRVCLGAAMKHARA